MLNFHSTKGTQWVAYINQNYFVSYGCPPPQKTRKYIIKQNINVFFSEYKIQGLDSHCAAFCLDIIYLIKIIGVDFKTAVSIVYYQNLSFHN